MTHRLVFCVWLLLLSIVCSRFILIVAWVRISFLKKKKMSAPLRLFVIIGISLKKKMKQLPAVVRIALHPIVGMAHKLRKSHRTICDAGYHPSWNHLKEALLRLQRSRCPCCSDLSPDPWSNKIIEFSPPDRNLDKPLHLYISDSGAKYICQKGTRNWKTMSWNTVTEWILGIS